MSKSHWLILFALSLSLNSCVLPKRNLSCDIPSSSTPETLKSNPINISINVDGSGSMLGYVKSGKSRYIQALELLDQIFSLNNSRSNSKVEYYRIGHKKINRSDFRDATKPEFYDGSNPSKFPSVTSPITQIITPPEKDDKLLVIVTDLEQNDGDVTILNKKIQDSFFNKERKDYAVGIIAIRSEFDGTVYAPDETRQNFAYNTNGKNIDRAGRPFYIMLIGPNSDITHYFSKFQENTDLAKSSQLIAFSPNNLVSSISFLQEPEVGFSSSLKRRSSLKKDLLLGVDDPQKFQLWETSDNVTPELPINYQIDFNQVNYALPIQTITSKLTVKTFDKLTGNKGDFKEAGNLSDALQVEMGKIDAQNKKLSFVTKFIPSKLSPPGVYLFYVDLVPQDLQIPSLWNEWSLNGTDQDGSKTYKLWDFMDGLKATTTQLIQNNPPLIGRFCYGVQKN